MPDCLDPTNPDYNYWPSDLDLEPNGTPETATVLPCGDDGVLTDPAEYDMRCPSRQNYMNGLMNMVICPASEQDMYSIYLLANEELSIQVLYQYSVTLPRDLDARVIRYDAAIGDYVEVAVGESNNDNEELTVSTATGSGNPQGWYYLDVHGKTGQDLNYYTVVFTLNPL